MKKKRETMKKGWFLVRETKRGRRRRREWWLDEWSERERDFKIRVHEIQENKTRKSGKNNVMSFSTYRGNKREPEKCCVLGLHTSQY